jgi:hypothetical protein
MSNSINISAVFRGVSAPHVIFQGAGTALSVQRLDYRLDDEKLGFSSRQGRTILLTTVTSRPALGPTQSPIQWVPGIKRQYREADPSPPLSAEVKNDGAILPLPDTSSWRHA